MGRCFSTVYRFIAVATSVSALVLGILSATSCAFVKFDHQYKSEGRRLSEKDVADYHFVIDTHGRLLQDPFAKPVDDEDVIFNDLGSATLPPTLDTLAEGAAPAPAVVTTSTAAPTKSIMMGGMGDGLDDEEDSPQFGTAADEDYAPSENEPIATASGEAGLYCDGEQSLSITNLWGGSMQEFKSKVQEESDNNQSEELARGAVLASVIVGSVLVFVLIMESLFGWRICCERYIVGVVAMVACLSQGLTFLFFNSERYCDGDIINEILNQEPCVIGEGGIYSAISVGLYFVTLVMACRLPQDDPYGLCCKAAAARRNEKNDRTFVGSSDTGNVNDTEAGFAQDENREKPKWMGDEANKQESDVI